MRFSIIMPVLNEEKGLEDQLTSLKRCCQGFDYELLIVDGGSSDGTQAIAEKYGRVIRSARGRATQMNAGAALARGDVLLFLHADTRLPAQALTAIEQALNDAEIIGGAFQIKFDRRCWPYRLVAFSINLRSRLSQVFTGDQAYFIRATSFRAIGGYPEQPLMEDLEIIKKLRAVGTIRLLPLCVTTSARRHEQIGLVRSVFFMWYLRTLYSFGVPPARLQRIYRDIR